MSEAGWPIDTEGPVTLCERLAAALGDAKIPTGAPIPQILYDLFLAEARQQGDLTAEQAWMSLETSAITELAREFVWRMARPSGSSYYLPAGTEMIVCMFGCAIIGSEELGIDVDRPGLHDIKDMPCRPGGSNLSRLLRLVDEMTSNLPCRAIGLPTLVDRFSGSHLEYRLQFPAFAPAGSIVLQREMDFASWGDFFCAFTAEMIDKLAVEIVADMQRLWAESTSFALRVRSTKRSATRLAAQMRGVRVHAVTLNISNQLSGGDQLAVEFNGWDHARRRGIVVQKISSRPYATSTLDAAALDLADEVAALHALSADGRISVLARAVVDAAPQGAPAVLNDLANDFQTFVTLNTRTGPLPLRLYWQHGEICAATRGGHKVEVEPSHVLLRDETLSETLITSLPGKPVYVVFNEPFRCDAKIGCVENKDGGVVVTPEADPWLVNCRAGRMWRHAQH